MPSKFRGNFSCRCAALLIDRGRIIAAISKCGDVRGSNLFDHRNRVWSQLHSCDLAADVIGCFRGLRGERLSLLRNNRKPRSGFARASRPDRGVSAPANGLFRIVVMRLTTSPIAALPSIAR